MPPGTSESSGGIKTQIEITEIREKCDMQENQGRKSLDTARVTCSPTNQWQEEDGCGFVRHGSLR